MALVIYVQEWEESEAGWGTRPDGYRLYTTLEETKEGTKKILKQQKEYFDKELGPGVVPCEYDRPCGKPFVMEVSEEFHKEVSQKEGMWVRYIKNDIEKIK